MTVDVNFRREKLLKMLALEIDGLLEWEQRTERPNLTQLEDVVLAARQRIGIVLTENLLAGQQADLEAQAALPLDPNTGKYLHNKGKKKPVV
jgi:hypothetical protein